MSGSDGSATSPALPLTGTYTVSVSKQGFGTEERDDVTLRAGETATLRVKLLVGIGEVRGHGLRHRPRACAPTRRSAAASTARQIDETPILGRKVTTLPLLNSAFRQGKGTGDLFVNATYFVTGGGSRRTTTFMLDGANNDEGWGRQTMIATVPLGAMQEIAVLSNAFSAEFGWTAGPALNIVTKSGTNDAARRGAVSWRAPAAGRRRRSRPTASARRRSPSCVTPTTLTAINPADVPDALNQFSGVDRRAARQGQDVLLRDRRLHARRIGRRSCRRRCRRSCCRRTAASTYVGQLPPGAVQRAASITSSRRRRR